MIIHLCPVGHPEAFRFLAIPMTTYGAYSLIVP